MEGAGLGKECGEKTSRKSTAGLRVGCFEGAVRSCTPIFHAIEQRRSLGAPNFHPTEQVRSLGAPNFLKP
jgi:hypothetical protein